MLRLVRIAACLLPTLALFVPTASAQPKPFYRPEVTAADIDSGCRRDWYGVYFQNTKIGYFNTNRERTKEGIRESVRMTMKIASFGQKIEMNVAQDLVFDAKAPHALAEGTYSEEVGRTKTAFAYKRTEPGVYDVLQSTAGNVRSRSVKFDYALGDSMAVDVWIRRGQEVGAEMSARDFEPKEQKIETQTSKVVSTKTTQVSGVDVKYFEVLAKSTQDNLENVLRLDDQGRLLSGKVGGAFDLRLESEAEAKNTSYGKDLFVFGMAKVDRNLGERQDVKELVVDVEGPAELVAFNDGPRQKVKSIDKTTSRLEIGKRFGKSAKATRTEIDENLAESSTHHIQDPKVKALAAKAIGDAKTDVEKVKNLVKFVHGYVIPTYDASQPNIHDLIERKKGDCKSYALLFTNLARASGLPAREVMGLLYVGDKDRAFGGHAWNEVVLDGEWVPIDATFDETEIDATHLCFGTQRDASRTMLESLGKLNLKVIEVNGK